VGTDLSSGEYPEWHKYGLMEMRKSNPLIRKCAIGEKLRLTSNSQVELVPFPLFA
jgi:hypothetical protein